LFRNAYQGQTKFAVTRYGNIAGSRGSVIPRWLELKQKGEDTVPVTNPDCTRFFMKIDEAVDLVLDTVKTMRGGELNIPNLPAYRLGDVAEAMGMKMRITGLPEWEKLREGMADGNTSDTARRMTQDELRGEIEVLEEALYGRGVPEARAERPVLWHAPNALAATG
jgi:FlaA1/EpsC-like NDP-sugar epimerase